MSTKEDRPLDSMEEKVEAASNEEQLDSAEEKSENVDSPDEEVIEDPIVVLERQLNEEKNKYLRLYAEFENFRRRSAKERLELIGTASSDVIKDLLPIIDDFSRAIESNKNIDEIDSIKEGFELLMQKMTKTLESKGLKPIKTKGEMFDAEIHEAIAQMPVSKAKEKGLILDEIERGYTLNEKIIRHPKVVVGS